MVYKGIFFILESPEQHFPGLFCLKQKNGKNSQFLTKNHGLTPSQKNTNFRLFKLLVFIVYKKRFSFLEHREALISGLFCLK